MIRKLVYFAVAIVAIVVVSAIALPLLISSEAVRNTLLTTAKEITGRKMEFNGTPKVSFNPFLGIEIVDVTFKDQFGVPDSPPILSMQKLKAKLSIASALTGTVKLTEFQFIRPKFNLRIFSTGQSSWQFEEGKVWDVLANAKSIRDNTETGKKPDIAELRVIDFGSFSIVDGVVEYENEITGANETVTNVNGDLVWPNTVSAWDFQAKGIWRGDAISFANTMEEPIFVLSGGSSQMTAKVESEPVNISFTGEINRFSDLFLNGQIDVNSSSLRRLANLFGAKLNPGSTFGQFNAKGMFSGTISEFGMDDAEYVLDGNAATGTLNIGRTENDLNKLTGTLAFSKFDFAPYLLNPDLSATSDNSIVEELRSLFDFEMDLRVSSTSVIARDLEISNYAGGIKNKDGVLAVTIGNAEIAGGLVVGNAEISAKESNIVIATDINISDLKTESIEMLHSISKIQPVGSGNVGLKLSSEGENIDGIVRNLTGQTDISFKNGALNGIALESIDGCI